MSSWGRGRCQVCDRRHLALARSGLCWRCYSLARLERSGDPFYHTWWRLATIRVYQLRAARRLPLFATKAR